MARALLAKGAQGYAHTHASPLTYTHKCDTQTYTLSHLPLFFFRVLFLIEPLSFF